MECHQIVRAHPDTHCVRVRCSAKHSIYVYALSFRQFIILFDLHIIRCVFDLQGVRSDNKNVHCSFLSGCLHVCMLVCVCVIAWFISILMLVLLVIFYLPTNAASAAAAAHNIQIVYFILQMQICNFDQSEPVYMCQSFVWMFVIFWQVLFYT